MIKQAQAQSEKMSLSTNKHNVNYYLLVQMSVVKETAVQPSSSLSSFLVTAALTLRYKSGSFALLNVDLSLT